MIECTRCLNTSDNPAITFDSTNLCSVCALYENNFDKGKLHGELAFLHSLKKQRVMVGISGGKDSTATLYRVIEMGFKPITFTFNLGYYPSHIFPRAKKVAEQFNILHQEIGIRHYATTCERLSYTFTAQVYEACDDPEEFKAIYAENRKHYSIKSKLIMPYIRSCQLCRRSVIRAYYGEAVRLGCRAVILGMNEWAGLSGNGFTGIRKLKPYPDKPEVYVVHLPFLLQSNIQDTAEILKKLGWEAPTGEYLVESNSNSCLLARATEEKATRLLGFHPDTTRLSREITVGFISKEQGRKALTKKNPSDLSVRKVLQEAGLLWNSTT